MKTNYLTILKLEWFEHLSKFGLNKSLFQRYFESQLVLAKVKIIPLPMFVEGGWSGCSS